MQLVEDCWAYVQAHDFAYLQAHNFARPESEESNEEFLINEILDERSVQEIEESLRWCWADAPFEVDKDAKVLYTYRWS